MADRDAVPADDPRGRVTDEPLRALVGQARAMKEQIGILAIQADALERQAITMAMTVPRVEPETPAPKKQRNYMMGDTGHVEGK